MPLRVVIKYNVEFAGTLSEGWSPYPKMNIINIDSRMVSEIKSVKNIMYTFTIIVHIADVYIISLPDFIVYTQLRRHNHGDLLPCTLTQHPLHSNINKMSVSINPI